MKTKKILASLGVMVPAAFLIGIGQGMVIDWEITLESVLAIVFIISVAYLIVSDIGL